MSKKILIGSGAFTLYCAVAYGAFKIQKVRNRPEPHPLISEPSYQRTLKQNLFECYSDLASKYDSEISTDEWMMGLPSKRRRLVEKVDGDVLEISVGTGRNIDYYSKAVNHLVLADRNQEMLDRAKAKALGKRFKISALVQNAEKLDFGPGTFDHVVDTFGVCSFDDPVKALKEMARVVKPGGTIRLLEHGRGDYDAVNEFLDKSAQLRSRQWGCWYNRDIESIVKQAGLKILEHKKYHFGTTSFIIATVD